MIDEGRCSKELKWEGVGAKAAEGIGQRKAQSPTIVEGLRCWKVSKRGRGGANCGAVGNEEL